MDNLKVENIILERQFEVYDASGNESELVLKIAKPVPEDPSYIDDSDWRCTYEITGPSFGSKISFALGVDSIQALVLALTKADAELRHYQRKQNIKITWLEQPDLGLPTATE